MSGTAEVSGPTVDISGITRIELWLAEVGRRHPDAVAVEYRDRLVTYAELDARSDAMAERVIATGIGSGRRIAVCMERTDHLPVALIAIWKAGCSYLPISADHPAKRRDLVVELARPVLWLIDRASLHYLPAGVPFIVCDEAAISPGPTRVDTENEAVERLMPLDSGGPDAVAYTIFTSGSTGVPKGVDIVHRSAVNFLMAMQTKPGLDRDGVVLGISTLTFDISVLEIFLPLSVGARVVMVPQCDVRDMFALVERLATGGATLLQGTPTTWRLLLDAGFRSRPELAMLCGGEPLTRALADRLLEGGGSLWNMYGPTETTVWSSAEQILPDGRPISIGMPNPNVSFHVVDDDDRPVPVGVQGRLLIGGAGLSRGYVGDPRQTEAAFFEDPAQPGRFLYRTGDRATVHADGRTTLSGRDDRQVKLRGFRIELGEVEAAMEACGLAMPAAVLQPGGRSGDRIVGFYQTGGAARDPQTLRAELLARLPAYMVPAAFVALADMPKGSSGKTDLKTLGEGLAAGKFDAILGAPPPCTRDPAGPSRIDAGQGAGTPVGSFAGPTDVHARLMAIFADVLGLTAMGSRDDFFDLGGSSLQAFDLIVRLRQAFGFSVGVNVLMRHPSVEAMTRWIETSLQGDGVSDAAPATLERRTPIFGLHDTVLFRDMVAQFDTDQPFFFIPEPDGVREPGLDYGEIAALYLADVRKTNPSGPYAFVGFCFAGRLALEVARQAKVAGDDVDLVVAIDAWGPGIGPDRTHLERALQATAYRAHRVAAHVAWLLRNGLDGLRQLHERSEAVGHVIRSVRGWIDRTEGRKGEAADPTLQLIDMIDLARRRYPQAPYEGDVLVLHGDACPKSIFIEPTFGWDGAVNGDLRIHRVRGEHLDIWKAASLREMSATIAESLAARRALGPKTRIRRTVLSEAVEPAAGD